MEAAFTKFRTAIAIVAMIVVAAATMQAVAPASGEPARMPGGLCPPNCSERRRGSRCFGPRRPLQQATRRSGVDRS